MLAASLTIDRKRLTVRIESRASLAAFDSNDCVVLFSENKYDDDDDDDDIDLSPISLSVCPEGVLWQNG